MVALLSEGNPSPRDFSNSPSTRNKGAGAVQLHISANDGLPIYLQIVNQVKYLVASGRLKPGEELPPIRVLAERLLINHNTVARANRELEAAPPSRSSNRRPTIPPAPSRLGRAS
jgi:hypothetical protein